MRDGTLRANGWTGGQYSLYRFALGLYLMAGFAALAIADAPGFTPALLIVGFVSSALFAVGFHDRAAAVVAICVCAYLVGRNPEVGDPGIPIIGLLLLAHLFVPRHPYGSWHACGRPDPGGAWFMPQPIYRVAWFVLAVGYAYRGWVKLNQASWLDGTALHHALEGPLARSSCLNDALLALPATFWAPLAWAVLIFELLFGLLALFRRLRPWIWLAMLLMNTGLILVIDPADLGLGLVFLHLFTFDPAWIRPGSSADKVTLFYDGACGLCHRTVRFILAEDRVGEVCDFAPLQGELFFSLIDVGVDLPDSLLLRRADGTLLFRSDAVVVVLSRLGGAWRVFGFVLWLMPRFLRDLGYRLIASIRRKVFPAPPGVCPIVPPKLASRFVMHAATTRLESRESDA